MLYIIQSTHLTWLCGLRALALDVVLSIALKSQDYGSLSSRKDSVVADGRE